MCIGLKNHVIVKHEGPLIPWLHLRWSRCRRHYNTGREGLENDWPCPVVGEIGLGLARGGQSLSFYRGRAMLKSCPYCGMIHPTGYECPKKPAQKIVRTSNAARFRKSWAWQRKRDCIVARDFSLCRVCNEGSFGVFGIPGLQRDLSVHHIEPLEENFDLRLEDDNLLTCCDKHHRMAEDGKIPRSYLHALARTSPQWGSTSGAEVRQD